MRGERCGQIEDDSTERCRRSIADSGRGEENARRSACCMSHSSAEWSVCFWLQGDEDWFDFLLCFAVGRYDWSDWVGG